MVHNTFFRSFFGIFTDKIIFFAENFAVFKHGIYQRRVDFLHFFYNNIPDFVARILIFKVCFVGDKFNIFVAQIFLNFISRTFNQRTDNSAVNRQNSFKTAGRRTAYKIKNARFNAVVFAVRNGDFVNTATQYQPLLMGIVVSVVVGIVLTLPISSAALCAMISISGIAGGAAVVGCCCQMVGFAACSFRENKWGGVVSQGLGTSMLQMGNICRHPQIWIAPTLASAICGPLSTMVFGLECSGVSAGMGTCGLVGPIGIIADSGSSPMVWVGIVLLCIVLPAVLSIVFNEIMRKLGWVKDGYMKI